MRARRLPSEFFNTLLGVGGAGAALYGAERPKAMGPSVDPARLSGAETPPTLALPAASGGREALRLQGSNRDATESAARKAKG